jgi:hypothetical protein
VPFKRAFRGLERLRGLAGHEYIVAARQHRAVTGSRVHRQILRTVLLHLEAFPWHGGDHLHFDILTGKQKLLMQIGSAGRNVTGEEFTPHVVICINRMRARIVLIDTHDMPAVGAAGLQHLRKIGEYAL